MVDIPILLHTVHCRVECGFFFIGQNRSNNHRSRSGMILEVQIQNLGARVKVFILKKFQGAQIGMKLPFTKKNKRRNTILKSEF